MKTHQILLALAEEDPHSLSVIQSALARKGHHVTTETSNGLSTERMLPSNLDLVITDLPAVLERVKELNPEIKAILVLETSTRAISTVRAIRSSADDYLFRPFGLAELEMRVSHCVGASKTLPADEPPERDLRLNEKILNIVKAMSHDVRGSLLSISATLKLLSRGHYGKMDEAVGSRIKELFSKTSGLIGITEEYLGRGFSIDDDFNTEFESLDLMKDILIPVLQEISRELKGHHLLIDHHLHAMSNKPIRIRTNRIWLKMVFRNLLKNATKYGDKAGMIAIGFEDQGSCYRLNVFNSGKPVPEASRKKLFTKFMGNRRRGNGGEETDGTGLGLYLIQKVILKLGGKIWYEPEENGSNFLFTLPCGSASCADSPLPIRAQWQTAADT
jgi:signal transduction histidine kinase